MTGCKKCIHCKEWKPFDNFHRDRTRKDGYAQQCKECMKAYQRVYQRENKDRLREYQRSNLHLGRAKTKKYAQSNKEKIAAKAAVGNAIVTGKLPAQATQKCANPACNAFAQQYHHWSYDKENWLSVIPLCARCHYAIHRGDLEIDRPADHAVTVK